MAILAVAGASAMTEDRGSCAARNAIPVTSTTIVYKTLFRTRTRTAAVAVAASAGRRVAEKRQLADALDFDEALALLESQYQTDPVNPEDDRNGLSARHLCPVCPAGVRVLAVGSKSGARPQGCCTRRKTVTARRTRTKIVTKWTSLPTKVASLSGRLYIDVNSDGIFTSGVDVPIGFWPVTLAIVTIARSGSRSASGKANSVISTLAHTQSSSDGSWTLDYTAPPPGTKLGLSFEQNPQNASGTFTVPSNGSVPSNAFSNPPANFTCSSSLDCPVDSDIGCVSATCKSGTCSYSFAQAGTPCSSGGCNGAGLCKAVTTTQRILTSSMATTRNFVTSTAGVGDNKKTSTSLVGGGQKTTTVVVAPKTSSATPSQNKHTTSILPSTTVAAGIGSTTTTNIAQTTSTTTTTTKPCVWNFDPSANVGDIVNIAGSNTFGDNGPATAAQLSVPTGFAQDGAGNFYVASQLQHVVRKIHPNGTITLFAGSYNPTGGSYSGDGGPATNARFNSPNDVLATPSGDLLISDSSNNRVRIVYASNGTVATFAGIGAYGFSGDGGPATSAKLRSPSCLALASNGDVYICDSNSNRIRIIDHSNGNISTFAGTGGYSYTGDGGPATSATFKSPQGLAIDSVGRVYISDSSNFALRVVEVNGTIRTVGDGTVPGLYYPAHIFADSADRVWVADSNSRKVRVYDPVSGTFTTVAGNGTAGSGADGGPATSSPVTPNSIVVDAATGDFYIEDAVNHKIRLVTNDTGIISTFAGTGDTNFGGDGALAVNAEINAPSGIAVDDSTGDILFADTSNNRIRRIFASNLSITTFVGTGVRGVNEDGLPGTATKLAIPVDVIVGPDRALYIADSDNNVVKRADLQNLTVTTYVGVAKSPGSAGEGDGGPATSAKLSCPNALAFDGAGNLLIADYCTYSIRKVDAITKTITTIAGLSGNYGSDGDGGPAINATFSSMNGIAVNSAGTMVWIADSDYYRIRQINLTSGVIDGLTGGSTSGFQDGPASSALFRSPNRLKLDSSERNLFVADSDNNVIRKIDLQTLMVETVAGNTTSGDFVGNGGQALGAPVFRKPGGVALDATGSLFVADTGNNRIRAIRAACS